jgi:hypothetical protein
MSINVRKPETLDHTRLFDEGCVKSRLDELTKAFIAKFAHDEMLKMADKAKRAFKPIPMYPQYSESALMEKFGEQARKQALKILEQERQEYVNYHSERIKAILNKIIKRLRFLVYAIDEKGKPTKLKVIIEKVTEPDFMGKYRTHEIMYVETMILRD